MGRPRGTEPKIIPRPRIAHPARARVAPKPGCRVAPVEGRLAMEIHSTPIRMTIGPVAELDRLGDLISQPVQFRDGSEGGADGCRIWMSMANLRSDEATPRFWTHPRALGTGDAGRAMIFGPVRLGGKARAPSGPQGRRSPGAAGWRPPHPAGTVKRKVQAGPVGPGDHRVERARHRRLALVDIRGCRAARGPWPPRPITSAANGMSAVTTVSGLLDDLAIGDVEAVRHPHRPDER